VYRRILCLKFNTKTRQDSNVDRRLDTSGYPIKFYEMQTTNLQY
jgi:hypothetical protein